MSLSDKIIEKWWGSVSLGVVMLGLTFLLYRQLSELDSGKRDSVLVSGITKMAYDLGGVWGATALGILFSLILIAWGLYQLLASRKCK